MQVSEQVLYETNIRTWGNHRDLMDSVEREGSSAHSVVNVVTELHVYCQSGIWWKNMCRQSDRNYRWSL